MKNKTISGELLILFSVMIYGMYGILSRLTSEFDSFVQPLFRYLFVIIFICLISILSRISFKKILIKDIKWFLVWTIPSSIQPILTFISFKHLPVGTVYFLIYFTTIIGGIISGFLFFNEKFTKHKLLSLLVVTIGIYLIFSSENLKFNNIYVITSTLSGLILGFWNTLSKKISGNYPTLQMMLIDSVSAILICGILLIFIPQSIPSIASLSWLWLVVFSIAGVASSFLLISGFKKVEAQIGSLIMPTEIIFAAIFGFIFLGERLNFYTYLGGFLIFLAAIIPSLSKNDSFN